MKNIWFTSDTHFAHKNIVLGTTTWPEDRRGGCRKFETLEEHDQTIVDNFNSLVKENDIVYHMGDWSFGGHENIGIFRKMIKCKNIHLILGNHDHHIAPKDSPYRSMFASVHYINKFSIKWDGEQMGKIKFFLSHYSHQVWENSHHGSIHLFGHSHGTLNGLGKSMDVGVDTHNYYPYSIEEIMYFLKDVNTHSIDHHNEYTT